MREMEIERGGGGGWNMQLRESRNWDFLLGNTRSVWKVSRHIM